jgi:hypothetical protein
MTIAEDLCGYSRRLQAINSLKLSNPKVGYFTPRCGQLRRRTVSAIKNISINTEMTLDSRPLIR